VNPIPHAEPLPLPAPAWLLWALLMLTFLLHVLAMNALLGGTLLAAYARFRRRTATHSRELLMQMAKPAPAFFAATVTLGVAPLLFLQALYGRLFFVSSILMAWSWLAVVPMLIVAYYTTYAIAHRAAENRIGGTFAYGVVAVLLLVIAFLYTNNMTLMVDVDRFAPMYNASGRGLHLNLADPSIWPRWLHMILGAIAVAGLVIVMAVMRKPITPATEWAVEYGSTASAGATALNIVVGTWWLTTLPQTTVHRLAGGDPTATLLLAVSSLAGMLTLLLLWKLRAEPRAWSLVWGAAAGMCMTLVTMLFIRDQVRASALKSAGFEPQGWVVTQWGPLLLFVVLLVVAIAVTGWMALAFFRGSPNKEPASSREVAV
jgi:hypothetical protein